MYFFNIPTSFRIIFLSVMIEMDVSKFAVWMRQKRKKTQLRKKNYLQGTNISHLGKRKIIFKSDFWWDMLVPWRVPLLQVIMEVEKWLQMKRTYCWRDPFFHWIMIVGGRGNLRAGSIWRQVTRSRGPSLSQYAIIWLWGVLASLSGSTSESRTNWRDPGETLGGSGSVHVCALPSSVWTVWRRCIWPFSHAQSAWRCEGQCIHLCRQWHCREHLWHSQNADLVSVEDWHSYSLDGWRSDQLDLKCLGWSSEPKPGCATLMSPPKGALIEIAPPLGVWNDGFRPPFLMTFIRGTFIYSKSRKYLVSNKNHPKIQLNFLVHSLLFRLLN